MPGLTDTLLRTADNQQRDGIGKVLAQADLVIKPSPIGVGLMEYHRSTAPVKRAGGSAREKRCHK